RNFRETFIFKETQDDRLTISFSKTRDGVVKQGRQLVPLRITGGCIESGLHISLLFAALTTIFSAEKTEGRQAGRGVEPAFKDGVGPQTAGFFREDDKDSLRDLFGVRRVSHLPPRCRIDEVD